MIHKPIDFMQELRNIIASSIDCMITINKYSIIQHINPAPLLLYGYKEEEILGLNIQNLIPRELESEGADLYEYQC